MAAVKQWEYHLVAVDLRQLGAAVAVEQANLLGDEGWDLVGVETNIYEPAGVMVMVMLWFKREKKGP